MITELSSNYFAASEAASSSIGIAQANYDALGTSLWDELTEGRCVTLSSTHTPTHCVLEIARCTNANARRPRERKQFEYLRRILIGEAPKAVAFASGRSLSTLAVASGDALNSMRVKRGILYVPYLLVRAAHVASGGEFPACRVTLASSRQSYYVSIERPDLQLAHVLSAGECVVAGLMMEGYSNHDIAIMRRVSVRTVANQISSLFIKLHTSGRAQLLCALVAHERTGWLENSTDWRDTSRKAAQVA